MEPSVRQALIYDYLRYCAARDHQPSYLDVAAACSLSLPLVQDDLESLRGCGCIDWSGKQAASIQIIGPLEYALAEPSDSSDNW